MQTYDFHGLSDADFEDLVCDLLNAALGVRFQMFTAGRDGGIDLLLGAIVSQGVVVQCKHFWRSGFDKLKGTFAKTELPKLAKLKPARYIVATSVPLTPANKQSLLALLSPYCLGLDDIFGRDDLITLLRAHPSVETTHYKLWLTSIPVLQRVLRQGSVLWNALTKADIQRKMSLFVQTAAYGVALDILRAHNYCVISGIPGIGKTTLAQVLVTRLLEDGFELIAIRDDIGEALGLLDLSKRQVVYYDDFLGRSSLGERLGKNEDVRLLRLLDEAKRSKMLKVILTTREYILNDARRLYEPLGGPQLEVAKCIVKVEDYTRRHRARILYNHIYFSDLTHDHAAALSGNRGYKAIVDHKNYNPRIVEWMTSSAGAAGAERFVDAFVTMLDNPLRVWEHAFDNQIGEDARTILFCLASVTTTMPLDELRAAWVAMLHGPETPASPRLYRDRFNAALKHIDGSFIRTERSHQTTGVSFHNPSIRDYVARRVADDEQLFFDLLSRAPFFDQIDCLAHLDPQGHVHFEPAQDFQDCEQLRHAIKRSIAAQPAILQSERSARGETLLWHTPLNIGARLSRVAGWTKSLGTSWLDFTCEVAAEQLEAGDVAKTANTQACGFVSAVKRQWEPTGGKWSSLVRRFVTEIASGVAADGRDAGEWAEWSRFINDNKSLFSADELEDWQDRAYTYCVNEIDVICSNADSELQAENWFEEVSAAAEAWGFSLAAQRKDLDKWIAAKESTGGSDEEWEGSGYGADIPDTRATDRELDRLFGSLASRDL
jgi:hypothetical protein